MRRERLDADLNVPARPPARAPGGRPRRARGDRARPPVSDRLRHGSTPVQPSDQLAAVGDPLGLESARSPPRCAAARRGRGRSRSPPAPRSRPQGGTSAASRPVSTPPIPTSGTSGRARCTSHTMRSAIGFTAGPESPPQPLASTGRRAAASIAIARMVLMSVRASAPPATAARAIATRSGAFGESFTHSGRRVASRHHLASARAAPGRGRTPCRRRSRSGRRR